MLTSLGTPSSRTRRALAASLTFILTMLFATSAFAADGDKPGFFEKLAPIAILLAVVAFVISRLPKVEGIDHSSAFERRHVAGKSDELAHQVVGAVLERLHNPTHGVHASGLVSVDARHTQKRRPGQATPHTTEQTPVDSRSPRPIHDRTSVHQAPALSRSSSNS